MAESEKYIIASKGSVEDIINRINSFSEGGRENAESIAVKKAWGKKFHPKDIFITKSTTMV